MESKPGSETPNSRENQGQVCRLPSQEIEKVKKFVLVCCIDSNVWSFTDREGQIQGSEVTFFIRTTA